jgi:diguanylate cyclase (GGDEF)-like protein
MLINYSPIIKIRPNQGFKRTGICARDKKGRPLASPLGGAGKNMFETIDSLLHGMGTNRLLGVCMLFVGLLGAIDHVTGYEWSFSIFYIAPVAAASWYGNRRSGVAVAVASAITWMTVDWTSGHRYSSVIILFWNAGVRLGFFLIVSGILYRLRFHLDRERALAKKDGLTAALNGKAFIEAARTLFDLARRYGHTTALGYVDLDNFKRVNDTRGHAEGDRALISIAELLLRSVRRTDVVGRLGGDEFGVLLPETSRAGAEQLFGKVRGQVLQQAKDAGWPITLSIGLAVFRVPPPSAEEGLTMADMLMYQVKKMGKNGILIEEFPPAGMPASRTDAGDRK